MATLDDLFKYKEKVDIISPKTGKKAASVWVRVLGDEDLKESFRLARIESAKIRAALRDETSDMYRDEIANLGEQPREDLEALILASKENEFSNQAPVIVTREDLPEIEEIALEPDAPTLEEQERLDRETETLDKKFLAAIEDYVQTKLNEVKAELAENSYEEVLEKAKLEYINVQGLQQFLLELNVQRGFRSSYDDEACTVHAFSSTDAFRNADATLKQQIIDAYNSLEIDTDEVKN